MGKKAVLLLLIIFLTLTIVPFLKAADEDNVIVNSENWQDVYSAMLYSSLNEASGDFLTSTTHGTTILNGIKKENSILVISSRDNPYVYNYPDIIRANGFNSANELTVRDANLELIDEFQDIQNFVIVGDSYGYNSIAVTPYAVEKHSWVFLRI